MANCSRLSSQRSPSQNLSESRSLKIVSKNQRPSLQNTHALVTLYIGSAPVTPATTEPSSSSFVVHKDFACFHSPVFKAAFSSEFLEGQTQTYRLEDTTKGAVRLLVHWLYTQKLDLQQAHSPEDHELKSREDLDLANLWVLADKLLIRKLQNCVIRWIDELRRCFKIVPTVTLDRLPFFFRMVHKASDAVSQEMLLELATALMELRTKAIRNDLVKARNMVDYQVSED